MRIPVKEAETSKPDPSSRLPDRSDACRHRGRRPMPSFSRTTQALFGSGTGERVEIFGFSADEAMQGGLDLIIPENLKAAHDRGFRHAVAAGKTKSAGRAILTRAKHKDSSKLYVEMSFAVVTDPSGGVSGALAIARDVTERRLAELARRATQK